MKVAILIGISEYETQTKLRGCRNDVVAMTDIILQTGNYNQILSLYDDETSSNKVKTKLPAFIKDIQEMGEEIEEVFFYYSGHGSFKNDEFYYILSDYDSKKLNRTTYKNEEIDELLKSLNPKLTIKVIDACESGVRYVKDTDDKEVQKLLRISQSNFNNCYFMFSSQNDESSYATNRLSYFTESYINAIIEHQSSTIRYRDIMDYISDDFMNRGIKQTPFYITQANNTETFAKITVPFKEKIKVVLQNFNGVDSNVKVTSSPILSLKDIIKKDAENYCTNFKEIENVFNAIKEQVENIELRGEFETLFSPVKTFDKINYLDLINIDEVAKVLLGKEDNYFIEMKYIVKPDESPFANLLVSISGEKQSKRILAGFEISEDELQYNVIDLELIPKYPNLTKYNINLIFAFSKVNLIVFYSYNKFKQLSWEQFEIIDRNWQKTSELLIKKEIILLDEISKIFESFFAFVLKDLNSIFKIEDKSILDEEGLQSTETEDLKQPITT